LADFRAPACDNFIEARILDDFANRPAVRFASSQTEEAFMDRRDVNNAPVSIDDSHRIERVRQESLDQLVTEVNRSDEIKDCVTHAAESNQIEL
jgi:hypothetical protein